MIRVAALDGKGAVKLLHEDDKSQLMLQSHERQGPCLIRGASQFIRVPVRSADEERHGLSALHLLHTDPSCEVHAAHLAPPLIEQHAPCSMAEIKCFGGDLL